MSTTRSGLILAAAVGLAAGCGPRSSNRSPTPDESPDRFARAVQEEEDARRQNRGAEARFSRRLGRAGIRAPDPEPLESDPTPNDPEIAQAHAEQ